MEKQTVYNLNKLVKRCLEESTRAGDIENTTRVENNPRPTTRLTIVNEDAVCDHIAKTIIGELHELEIVRKVAPIFRVVRSLQDDFAVIDSEEKFHTSLQGLRIETAKPEKAEK